MSFNVSKVSQLVAGLCVLAAVSGCQDALSPVAVDRSPRELPALSASRETNSEGEFVKDQYIVVLRDSESDVDGKTKKLMAGKSGKVKHVFKAGVKGFVAGITAGEAAALALDPGVAYVEQDQVIMVGVGKPVASTAGGTTRSGKAKPGTVAPGTVTQTPVPSWGIDRIDQTSSLLNNAYTYSATGTGVHAYIIDSGIRITHSDFQGRATADYSVIVDGYGAIGCNWHGSHVAGTVGGVTSGVAKKVLLHSVRVLDCNNAGTTGGVGAGIDWVIANRVMPAVINLSVSASSSQFLMDAVNRAVAAGIVVVVAAGNDGADACSYTPANVANAITVGSSDMYDQASVFSNQGTCVDLMAPGQYISSVSTVDDTSFQYGTGTSMAAPHVTGAAALYLEKNPLASPAAVELAILQQATAGMLSGLLLGSPNLLLRTQ